MHWLGHGLFDYADPLGPCEELAQTALPVEAGAWDIRGIRAHSPWRPVFKKLAQAAQGQFQSISAAPFCAGKSAVELDNEHDRIAGRGRDLERQGVGYEAVRERAERQRLLDQMLQWKQQRMGENNLLHEREAAWLSEMAAYDFCELWRMGDGQTWAGFLTWRHGHTRYGYMLAYDLARARFSPGIKLLYAVLRQSLAEGMRFDFLTGEQGFKLRFATGQEQLLRLQGATQPEFQR